MSTKNILVILIVFSFIFVNSANASIFPNRNLIPADSSFYFLQSWKESIQTFFTFGAENKAKQYLHLAEVRLDEYQKMAAKGKTEIAQKTLEKYQQQLNRALTKAEELKQKGKEAEDLTQKIEQSVAKHLEVLRANLEKVPEQARRGIENAIENSSEAIKRVSGQKLCAKEGKMCGGIAGIQCCSGLKCQLQGNYPDASGTCVKEGEKVTETCQNLCGDGVCQEVVCMAIGCPCAETKESCPEDCAKESGQINQVSIADILSNPNQYLDKKVQLEEKFCGWGQTTGSAGPLFTRSDWCICQNPQKKAEQSLTVTGAALPVGVSPSESESIGEILSITGVVKKTSNNIPYIEAEKIVSEICEINKEYESTAVNSIKCQCPEGYKFQVVSMGWGPCPEAGMSDCPASTMKCVKKQ